MLALDELQVTKTVLAVTREDGMPDPDGLVRYVGDVVFYEIVVQNTGRERRGSNIFHKVTLDGAQVSTSSRTWL